MRKCPGIGIELEAILACTIGGIVSGVLIFELLKTALKFLGVTPDLQYVAIGLVIVAAVAIDIRKYLAKKLSFIKTASCRLSF